MTLKKINLERIIDSFKQGSIRVGEKAIIPAVSFAMGFGAGKLGKAVGHQEIAAVPVAMDLTMGIIGKNHIIPYLAYGAGVAMNYLPQIYDFIQNFRT